MDPSTYVALSNIGVSAVKDSRAREKDIKDLNEGNYIEKVWFLEAPNRKLADEMLKFNAKWEKRCHRSRSCSRQS